MSAVELSSSLSTTLGVQLSSTLVFDYPSVSSMAQHIHALLVPVQAVHEKLDGRDLVPAATGLAPLHRSSELPHNNPAINIALATRLPVGYIGQKGSAVIGGADGIGLVPFGRWDLEAFRVRLDQACRVCFSCTAMGVHFRISLLPCAGYTEWKVPAACPPWGFSGWCGPVRCWLVWRDWR